MNIKEFRGKKCWVTGASSGIGAALATELNELGAHIVISARNQTKLKAVKDQCKHRELVEIISVDLEDIDQLSSISMEVWEILDGIDFAFLNAGFAVRDMITEVKMDLYEKILKVNFLSTVAISKRCYP